ncbi:TPA: methenyltetrahydrofolate cyclohydrolase [Candidatus Bipolaricaulota bacterium]|nr:methenyltetrahydrofolate cyclohydrolase [Candidatus Bipolaricaulota bacterium]
MGLLEEPFARLLEELSSGRPTPGGGAAAALSGAVAAALVEMVAVLTLGKEGYEAVRGEMEQIQTEAEGLLSRLAELIEADATAFEGVMAAYRLPKGDPARRREIEEALKRACAVPLETAEQCLQVLELAEVVASRGNKSAASDAGSAGILAAAGLESALLNVRTNLKSIKDEGFRRGCERQAEELAASGRRLKERILEVMEVRQGRSAG